MHVTLFMAASLGALACGVILSGFFMRQFIRQEFRWAVEQRHVGGYFCCAMLDVPVMLALSGAAYALPLAMFVSLSANIDDMALKGLLVALAWIGGCAMCLIFYSAYWQAEEKAFRAAWEQAMAEQVDTA